MRWTRLFFPFFRIKVETSIIHVQWMMSNKKQDVWALQAGPLTSLGHFHFIFEICRRALSSTKESLPQILGNHLIKIYIGSRIAVIHLLSNPIFCLIPVYNNNNFNWMRTTAENVKGRKRHLFILTPIIVLKSKQRNIQKRCTTLNTNVLTYKGAQGWH